MNVTAHATRTGDWWAVEVPEVPGVFTQAKRLDQIPDMVRDAVALLTDIDPATVEVDVVPAIPEALQTALSQAKGNRERAETLKADASVMIAQVAKELQAQDYSLRDIGVVLGVSHQRVAQLVATSPPMTIKEAGEAAIAATDGRTLLKARAHRG